MQTFSVAVSCRTWVWAFDIQAHDFVTAMDIVDEMTEGVEYSAIQITPLN